MEKELFICPVCGNKDPKYIGKRNNHYYCRRCISFRGEEVKETESFPLSADYFISYELTDDQKKLSEKILINYKNNINTLVLAVCGAGKTEIVLEVIKYAINCGDKVAFAIPRRDVVIELHSRFSSIFKENKIIYVCGGHTEELDGDLILLTTHQLYRYYNHFDLIILDEIDAFPFKGNELLQIFLKRACKKNLVMMSATPSDEVIKQFKTKGNDIVELYSRYHGYPLPVPKLYKGKVVKRYIDLYRILFKYVKKTKPVFIFTPTIEICERTKWLLSLFIKGGMCVHSKRNDRSKIIEDFKNKKYKYLVTTAVLERGVTFKDLQVIVFNADHNIYDSHALIQIAGRVGRKSDAPEGDVVFIAENETNEIRKTINEIRESNKKLQNLL